MSKVQEIKAAFLQQYGFPLNVALFVHASTDYPKCDFADPERMRMLAFDAIEIELGQDLSYKKEGFTQNDWDNAARFMMTSQGGRLSTNVLPQVYWHCSLSCLIECAALDTYYIPAQTCLGYISDKIQSLSGDELLLLMPTLMQLQSPAEKHNKNVSTKLEAMRVTAVNTLARMGL